jgi:large subunit ribosomal protein L33
MAKNKKDILILACADCGARNYTLRGNERKIRELGKLQLKKYCRHDRRHTVHKARRK